MQLSFGEVVIGLPQGTWANASRLNQNHCNHGGSTTGARGSLVLFVWGLATHLLGANHHRAPCDTCTRQWLSVTFILCIVCMCQLDLVLYMHTASNASLATNFSVSAARIML
jgi:hypothetical protein